MTTPSTSRLDPGPEDLLACAFTRLCRRLTPEYDVGYATNRALRDMATTPIFRHPKVFMMPIYYDRPLSDGTIEQIWYPWQVCTNCMAVRAKAHCELWNTALRVQQPLAVYHVRPGEDQTPFDVYAWFTDVREGFMIKDLGFYGPWQCRDGAIRPMVCTMPLYLLCRKQTRTDALYNRLTRSALLQHRQAIVSC